VAGAVRETGQVGQGAAGAVSGVGGGEGGSGSVQGGGGRGRRGRGASPQVGSGMVLDERNAWGSGYAHGSDDIRSSPCLGQRPRDDNPSPFTHLPPEMRMHTLCEHTCCVYVRFYSTPPSHPPNPSRSNTWPRENDCRKHMWDSESVVPCVQSEFCLCGCGTSLHAL
jgi:hypothetical protein